MIQFELIIIALVTHFGSVDIRQEFLLSLALAQYLISRAKVTAPLGGMQLDSLGLIAAGLSTLELISQHNVFEDFCQCSHLFVVPFDICNIT